MTSRFQLVICNLCLALCVGCAASSDAPELGEVSGVVTLDGQSVAQAEVAFTPEQGRPSFATTDENGKYNLRYSAQTDGAVVGTHSVSISTERDQTGGEGDQPLVPAQEERIPKKYNAESELTAQVSAGENTINFELKTE
ncbi:carboxypeptidase regulatory-like domain-containing protein [bacterium]|nr:carboxypeptidase regulatory-like domain-containing protein [bacterium]